MSGSIFPMAGCGHSWKLHGSRYLLCKQEIERPGNLGHSSSSKELSKRNAIAPLETNGVFSYVHTFCIQGDLAIFYPFSSVDIPGNSMAVDIKQECAVLPVNCQTGHQDTKLQIRRRVRYGDGTHALRHQLENRQVSPSCQIEARATCTAGSQSCVGTWSKKVVIKMPGSYLGAQARAISGTPYIQRKAQCVN